MRRRRFRPSIESTISPWYVLDEALAIGEEAENEKLVHKNINKVSGQRQAKRRRGRPEEKLRHDRASLSSRVWLAVSLVPRYVAAVVFCQPRRCRSCSRHWRQKALPPGGRLFRQRCQRLRRAGGAHRCHDEFSPCVQSVTHLITVKVEFSRRFLPLSCVLRGYERCDEKRVGTWTGRSVTSLVRDRFSMCHMRGNGVGSSGLPKHGKSSNSGLAAVNAWVAC